jgi:hypothetical protein
MSFAIFCNVSEYVAKTQTFSSSMTLGVYILENASFYRTFRCPSLSIDSVVGGIFYFYEYYV